MLDIDHIASQVKHNCNISDARYWGLYSPCGLLLRLRDLYKAERGLMPWDRVDNEEIGEWIGEREALWMRLSSSEFQDIEVMGRYYRPFDVRGINSQISGYGYLYAAGYGNLLKPFFMLSELSKQLRCGRYTIYICGREISRDLSTSPAMLQGDTIIARQDAMRFFLWGKFEEISGSRCGSVLFRAFREYGISKDLDHEDLEGAFERLTDEELATYVHHELGEASQRGVLGRWWREVLMNIPYSRAELFLRAVKDVLSDTCKKGMLAHIIQNKKEGSLAFYVALHSGYRRGIFPEIIEAYEGFMATGEWDIIEKARVEGYKRARYYVKILREYFDSGRLTQRVIEDELMPWMVR
jgi:hypothetical protein